MQSRINDLRDFITIYQGVNREANQNRLHRVNNFDNIIKYASADILAGMITGCSMITDQRYRIGQEKYNATYDTINIMYGGFLHLGALFLQLEFLENLHILSIKEKWAGKLIGLALSSSAILVANNFLKQNAMAGSDFQISTLEIMLEQCPVIFLPAALGLVTRFIGKKLLTGKEAYNLYDTDVKGVRLRRHIIEQKDYLNKSAMPFFMAQFTQNGITPTGSSRRALPLELIHDIADFLGVSIECHKKVSQKEAEEIARINKSIVNILKKMITDAAIIIGNTGNTSQQNSPKVEMISIGNNEVGINISSLLNSNLRRRNPDQSFLDKFKEEKSFAATHEDGRKF